MINQPPSTDQIEDPLDQRANKGSSALAVKAQNNPPPVSQNNPANPGSQTKRNDDGLSKRFLRDIEISDWITAVATAAIAAMTYFYTSYAREQMKIMRETLTEMRNSGQGTTDQTNKLIGNMNWLARTMDGALEQNRELRESSERQSRTSLAATINSFRLEQRPYMVLLTPAFLDAPSTPVNEIYIPVGKPLLTNVTVRNRGKTPAINYSINSDITRFQPPPCRYGSR